MIRATMITALTTLSGTMLAGTLMLATPAPQPAAAATMPTHAYATVIERSAPEAAGLRARIREAVRNSPERMLRHSLLRKTAEQTGLSIAEITTQLQAGSTLAQIADANGSSSAAVVEATLAEAEILLGNTIEQGRVTQEEAAQILDRIEQRANDMMQATDLGDQIKAATEQQMERMSRMVLVGGASEVTGLFPKTITVRLIGGETLAEIVTDAGYTTDAVLAAAQANAQERLDQLVERGLLSQAEADECFVTIQQNIATMINQPQLGR